jgi:Mat/Ecp fimbriae major subunit
MRARKVSFVFWQAVLAGSVVACLVGRAMPAFAACNRAITVTETQQMNYGTIAVTNGGGTVTISPSGTVSAPGGFALMGLTAAGKFHVTGSRNCAVVISFVAGSLLGPGAAMQIRNFTTNAGANPTLLPTRPGSLDFSVGADLLVNAGQAGGNYSGVYTVTVIY